MVSATSSIEGRIHFYWGCIYSKNTQAVASMVSDDITFTYTLSVTGKKQDPITLEGKAAFLACISKVANAITNVLKASFEFKKNADSNVIVVDYEQKIVVDQEGLLMEMYSKGKQIWTYSDTVFVALKVFEEDYYQKPYQISVASPVAVAPPVTGWSCVVM
jgi:hypothetical protein